MAHPLRSLCAATALTLALVATPVLAKTDPNRTLDSEHVPVVNRTDFVFDALTGPAGLLIGEDARLAGWFDGLGLGYGDTITLDTASAWRGAHPAIDAIGHVAADYGMLVSREAAPTTVGHPPAGSVRIVVSRAVATVPGCPDWSIGNTPTHNNTTTSNFGCASASNLAAMVANPEDLIEGQHHGPGDAMQSVKAIKTYRDATATGAGPLKSESSKSGGN